MTSSQAYITTYNVTEDRTRQIFEVRVNSRGAGGGTMMVHRSDLENLREAIDAMLSAG